jgi:nicotinate phosphoribosyltransferase
MAVQPAALSKRSIGKATWPGRKQVFREREATGTLKGDSIALATETQPGEPLLQEFMRQGRRIGPLPTLTASRAFCRQRVAELPAPLRTLTAVEDHPYPVAVSDRVRALADSLDSTGE